MISIWWSLSYQLSWTSPAKSLVSRVSAVGGQAKKQAEPINNFMIVLMRGGSIRLPICIPASESLAAVEVSVLAPMASDVSVVGSVATFPPPNMEKSLSMASFASSVSHRCLLLDMDFGTGLQNPKFQLLLLLVETPNGSPFAHPRLVDTTVCMQLNKRFCKSSCLTPDHCQSQLSYIQALMFLSTWLHALTWEMPAPLASSLLASPGLEVSCLHPWWQSSRWRYCEATLLAHWQRSTQLPPEAWCWLVCDLEAQEHQDWWKILTDAQSAKGAYQHI